MTYDFIGNYQNNDNTAFTGVGFFSLRNDGDSALVRFMHDSINDFEIITRHVVRIDGKLKQVNCLRNAGEPSEACPFCLYGIGEKAQPRIYIKLIQYMQDEKGQIIAVPKIWERSIAYARTLKGLLDEYGPLSKCVYRVRRQGAPGAKDTTYSINYQNPSIYNEQQYPIAKDLFNDYHVFGRVVLNKSEADMTYFANNGQFPPKQQENVTPANWNNSPSPAPNTFIPPVNSTPTYTTSSPTFAPMASTSAEPVTEIKDIPTSPTPNVNIPSGQMPWDNPAPSFNPPRRY